MMKKSIRKRRDTLKTITLIIAGCILCLGISALISILANSKIRVAEYELSGRGADEAFNSDELSIVLISDLHRAEFGEGNRCLIERTNEQDPDIICLVGDMLERDCTDDELASFCSLLSRFVEIAPTYLSCGNHDESLFGSGCEFYLGSDERTIRERLESTGVIILDNEYVDTELSGQSLRIGGTIEYGFPLDSNPEGWATSSAFTFLSDFCNTDRYKLLLCHRPDSFIFGDAAKIWDIDLVLSGHTHNGVVALPWGQAIYAPDQGFLPQYARGSFEIDKIHMIISGGLAGSQGVPRVFNPPEIVKISIRLNAE